MVTSEEMQMACKEIVRIWGRFAMDIRDITDVFNRIWKRKKPKSSKHVYHFLSKHRHVKSRLICTYTPDLKSLRNLPYQRRNY